MSGVDKPRRRGVWLTTNVIDSPVPLPSNAPRAYPQFWSWLAIAAGWLIVGLAGGWLTSDAAQYGWFYAENGPIEAFEAFINYVIGLIFLFRATRTNDMVGAWSIVIGAAFLAAGLHEFPRCGGASGGGACIPASTKHLLFGAIAVLAVIGLLYKRQDPIASLHPRWTFLFWPLGFTALFFVAAQLVEKASMVSYEEFLEFSGGMVALSMAVWLVRRT